MTRRHTFLPFRRIDPAVLAKAQESARQVSEHFALHKPITKHAPVDADQDPVMKLYQNRTGMGAGEASEGKNVQTPINWPDTSLRALKSVSEQTEHRKWDLPPAIPSSRTVQAEKDRLKRQKDRIDLVDRWRPWEGTPETHQRIEDIPSRRRQSALDRMHLSGTINADELAAGEEIARTVEFIVRGSSIRSASLESRVDCSGSAKDVLAESTRLVQLEVTYTRWRDKLPQPKALIVDAITMSKSYVAVAKTHQVPYREARTRLITALRDWISIRDETQKEITRAEIDEAHLRIESGS